MLKLLTVVLSILSLKIEEGFWIVRSEFFGRIYDKFSKIQTFFVKIETKYAFLAHFL